MLNVAHQYHDAGLVVVPPRQDGTKAPYLETWKRYQHERPGPSEIRKWYANGRTGIGTVCGAVAGNLELFEFDWYDTYVAFGDLAQKVGLGELVERIRNGYAERTPGGGIHWYYRCSEIGGATKLAERPEPTLDNPHKRKALIETKGEGGYAIMAPSYGSVHETGKAYEVLAGSVEGIVTITPEERRSLWDLARSFDEMPPREVSSGDAKPNDGDRPGDRYTAAVTWQDVLAPHGWKLVYRRGDTGYWRRPGKDIGISATTNHTGSDTLMVFSSSTPFEVVPTSYSKFAAYALLNHGGDYGKAGRTLWEEGYRDGGTTATYQERRRRDDVDPPSSNWPDPPAREALYGLPGRFVAAFEEHTEADPVALLVNFLSAFGTAVGQGPRFYVGEERHAARDNLVLVGQSSKARKGNSQAPVTRVFDLLPSDLRHRVVDGLSTGEGLISAVRDRVEKEVADKKTGELEIEVVDVGVDDKRLQVVEPEFARVLAALKRQGNTLSAVVRNAWDYRDLNTLTKSSMMSTKPHISVLGHVTAEELRRELDDTSIANGLANRFVFVAVRRARELPRPQPLPGDRIQDLAAELARVLTLAQGIGEMDFNEEADHAWSAIYHTLSADRGGLTGSLLARSEAHVLRLAMLYALSDASAVITASHLFAALAVWDYSESSVLHIFGDATGDAVADSILRALQANNGGMTRTEISSLLGRHKTGTEIDRALAVLERMGRAIRQTERTDGRPREVWSAA